MLSHHNCASGTLHKITNVPTRNIPWHRDVCIGVGGVGRQREMEKKQSDCPLWYALAGGDQIRILATKQLYDIREVIYSA